MKRINSIARNLGLAASLLVWATGISAARDAPETRPNIILILADDLGYGDLGCYGQERIMTPNLDRLAAEGIRFTDAYSGSTVCAPSRCSLMTGMHMGHARIRGNSKHEILPEDVTVAEVLRSAGYATAMFGKWGLGQAGGTGIPNRQGFEEWFGYMTQEAAHNYFPPFLWENEHKFTLMGNLEGRKEEYSPNLITERSLDYLEQRAAARIEEGDDRPFFLYIPHTLPHTNNELGHATGNGSEIPSDAPYSDRDWPAPERGFAAMVSKLDADVGLVLAKLAELGLDRNTAVIFTSDNGPHHEGGHSDKFFASSGPLRGCKRDLHEGGIRVPMIVRWPGRAAAGRVSDFPWAFWDLLPTVAEMARTPPPTGIDGRSVMPVLEGREISPPPILYWEFHERGFSQAARMGEWKSVRPGIGLPLEIYDLKADPAERHDLAAVKPEIKARFEESLGSVRTESLNWPIRNPGAQPVSK